MKIQANGSAEFENIFARISDSKRDFNGFPDPAIAADVGDSSILFQIFLSGFRIQGENGRAHLVYKS